MFEYNGRRYISVSLHQAEFPVLGERQLPRPMLRSSPQISAEVDGREVSVEQQADGFLLLDGSITVKWGG
jgi:hypothetical protein